ncbi:hypothetical protein R3P38DRAFT_3261794 [Favolaschia claudopus]|uniref:F-box domain-containing protein n=1 Tax=Favolaschia claudopus TaxID=2862362 RepID=A0AAW0CHB5_9AGAR
MSRLSETLRARVSQLDTMICVQEQLIQKLKEDRIIAKRELNAAVDPIARLPLEISSEIFLQAQATSAQPYGTPDGFAVVRRNGLPMHFLTICNHWTRIALATPELWCNVYITTPCVKTVANVLPKWLDRARNRPLSIFLHCKGVFDHRVGDSIWAYGQRLKHLEINMDFLDDGEEVEDGDDISRFYDGFEEHEAIGMNLWRPFSPATVTLLPTLEKLVIATQSYGTNPALPLCYHDLADLLCVSPNLVECRFNRMETVYRRPAGRSEIALPNLRRLMFGEDSDHTVLRNSSSLPCLEVLSVSCRRIHPDDLVSFFKRCSPPLRELVLKASKKDVTDYLVLVPDLQSLELWYADGRVATDLFSELAYPSRFSSLIPHLHTLIVHIDLRSIYRTTQLFWEKLELALVSRRAQLKVMQIRFLPVHHVRAILQPTSSTLAAFKELAEDGMQIHITDILDNEAGARD